MRFLTHVRTSHHSLYFNTVINCAWLYICQEAESVHNKNYWNGCQYIGVGPGAHGRFTPVGSEVREARIQTLEPDNWMFEVEKHGHATRKRKPLSQLDV